MNKSVLMIMGGALVLAVLVALMVQARLSPKGDGTAESTVEILVASKKLLTGEVLNATNVRWQTWPERSVFKGAITKADQPDLDKLTIYDAPLRRDVEAGEPVTTQAIIPDVKGSGNFLAASISPGMRAIAVSVKAQTMAGGFIAPGDSVDVIVAYSPSLPYDTSGYTDEVVRRHASQVVLSNVRVLAVDQTSKEEGREAKVAKTVTLEVTREGAEKVALAQRMGEITLALRRIGDVDPPDAPKPLVTDSTTSDVLRKVNSMKGKTDTRNSAIRLYSGSQIQNVPVRPTGTEEKEDTVSGGKAGN